MRNFLLKTAILSLIAIFVASVSLNAQPPAKAKERIEQLKKIKLLEVLNLSEEQADKFLVKYTSYEKNIGELREKLMKSADDLHEAIAKKSASEIKAKTDEHLKLFESMQNAMTEKNKGIRSVLDETQFAKYLIFEQKFMHELQKAIMNRGEDKDRPFEGKRGRR